MFLFTSFLRTDMLELIVKIVFIYYKLKFSCYFIIIIRRSNSCQGLLGEIFGVLSSTAAAA